MEEGIPSPQPSTSTQGYFSLPSRHSPTVRGVRNGIRGI